MKKIIVEINNQEDESFLMTLFEKLNLKVEVQQKENIDPVYWLQKIADLGSDQSIKEMEKWQNEEGNQLPKD